MTRPSPTRRTAIEVEMTLALLRDERAGAVESRWTYDSTAPLEVRILIHPGTENVEWVFARELITAGLHAAAGEGDVKLFPWCGERSDDVRLALISPDGSALLDVPRRPLLKFHRSTTRLVPLGRESAFLYVPDSPAALDDGMQS